jgi:hypothetical protein
VSNSITSNVRGVFGDLRKRLGLALAAAAAELVSEHQRRIGIANPRPYLDSSRPGEYPRKRTGFGQANVFYLPKSPAEIAAAGHVDVGYGENAFYMQALVDNQGRLGIEDTLEEMRPRLEAIVAAVAARSS